MCDLLLEQHFMKNAEGRVELFGLNHWPRYDADLSVVKASKETKISQLTTLQ
jgi:hypothetical protein